MRKIIINILYYSGIFHFLYMFNRMLGYFPILVFHRVTPNSDELTEPLNEKKFENILLFLNKKYNFCSLDDISTCKAPCLISFDDATTDFIDYVIPILSSHNFPVIFFIPTQAVESGNEIWTNNLFSFFYKNKSQLIKVNINGKEFNFALSGQGGVQELRKLINVLTELTPDCRREKIDHIISQFRETNISQLAPTLSWNALRNIRNNPKLYSLVSFGSHTHTHECLPSLDRASLHNELYQSKHFIERELKTNPISIAYPCGLYDQHIYSEIRKYYEYGFTTSGKLVNMNRLTESGYRYQIPRISIYTNNPKEIFMRINGLEIIITYINTFAKTRT